MGVAGVVDPAVLGGRARQADAAVGPPVVLVGFADRGGSRTPRAHAESRVPAACDVQEAACGHGWCVGPSEGELENRGSGGGSWAGEVAAQEARRAFCPTYVRTERLYQFLDLQQRDSTVVQYRARFVELGRYAPQIMADESLRTQQFVRGLRPELRQALIVTRVTDLDAAYKTAAALEADTLRTRARSAEVQTQTQSQPRVQQQQQQQAPVQQHQQAGGSSGSRGRGRVTHLTRADAEAAQLVEDSVGELSSGESVELAVELPTGDFVLTSYCLEEVPVQLQDQWLSARLFALQLQDYDVILGMDWLERYGAVMDCQKKRVHLRIPGEAAFYFQGGSSSTPVPGESSHSGVGAP
ncbi:hypothetical protein Taro_014050 [Colocasia esculenta]|uniref:Retrotransposon gag domain-containing protein n=1 Tax=Colocasia esculenta TaxID=4460 RepID=A0A843UP17_COLES|nr:hypothetical protein [Colocasia esculenta]